MLNSNILCIYSRIYCNQTYCIDLIGFPGVFEEALSLERWRMLERVGLRIFYLPFSKWHYDRALCERTILNFLENKSA